MNNGVADEPLLARLIGHARQGDLHALLGLPPGVDAESFLLSDPCLSHPYEAFVAAMVLRDLGESPAIDPDAWGIVECMLLDHDDEGHLMQRLNEDTASVLSLDRLVAADPGLAGNRWRAALSGPFPEGARQRLDALLPAMKPAVRAELRTLARQGDLGVEEHPCQIVRRAPAQADPTGVGGTRASPGAGPIP